MGKKGYVSISALYDQHTAQAHRDGESGQCDRCALFAALLHGNVLSIPLWGAFTSQERERMSALLSPYLVPVLDGLVEELDRLLDEPTT